LSMYRTKQYPLHNISREHPMSSLTRRISVENSFMYEIVFIDEIDTDYTISVEYVIRFNYLDQLIALLLEKTSINVSDIVKHIDRKFWIDDYTLEDGPMLNRDHAGSGYQMEEIRLGMETVEIQLARITGSRVVHISRSYKPKYGTSSEYLENISRKLDVSIPFILKNYVVTTVKSPNDKRQTLLNCLSTIRNECCFPEKTIEERNMFFNKIMLQPEMKLLINEALMIPRINGGMLIDAYKQILAKQMENSGVTSTAERSPITILTDDQHFHEELLCEWLRFVVEIDRGFNVDERILQKLSLKSMRERQHIHDLVASYKWCGHDQDLYFQKPIMNAVLYNLDFLMQLDFVPNAECSNIFIFSMGTDWNNPETQGQAIDLSWPPPDEDWSPPRKISPLAMSPHMIETQNLNTNPFENKRHYDSFEWLPESRYVFYNYRVLLRDDTKQFTNLTERNDKYVYICLQLGNVSASNASCLIFFVIAIPRFIVNNAKRMSKDELVCLAETNEELKKFYSLNEVCERLHPWKYSWKQCNAFEYFKWRTEELRQNDLDIFRSGLDVRLSSHMMLNQDNTFGDVFAVLNTECTDVTELIHANKMFKFTQSCEFYVEYTITRIIKQFFMTNFMLSSKYMVGSSGSASIYELIPPEIWMMIYSMI
jgi:hypothetical protein